MASLLTIFFAISLLMYLGIAARDILHHFSLAGSDTAVTWGESALHVAAGTLVTSIIALLWWGSFLLNGNDELRRQLLSLLPIALTVVGLADEWCFHRPRCRRDAAENWNHAVLHFSMGSCLVLGYACWF